MRQVPDVMQPIFAVCLLCLWTKVQAVECVSKTELQPPEDWRNAMSLAYEAHYSGDHAGAEAYAQEALEALELKKGDSVMRVVGETKHFIGVQKANLGRYRAALTTLLEALEVKRQYQDSYSVPLFQSHRDIGRILNVMEHDIRAKDHLERALDIAMNCEVIDVDDKIGVMNDLGSIFYDQGNANGLMFIIDKLESEVSVPSSYRSEVTGSIHLAKARHALLKRRYSRAVDHYKDAEREAEKNKGRLGFLVYPEYALALGCDGKWTVASGILRALLSRIARDKDKNSPRHGKLLLLSGLLFEHFDGLSLANKLRQRGLSVLQAAVPEEAPILKSTRAALSSYDPKITCMESSNQ